MEAYRQWENSGESANYLHDAHPLYLYAITEPHSFITVALWSLRCGPGEKSDLWKVEGATHSASARCASLRRSPAHTVGELSWLLACARVLPRGRVILHDRDCHMYVTCRHADAPAYCPPHDGHFACKYRAALTLTWRR